MMELMQTDLPVPVAPAMRRGHTRHIRYRGLALHIFAQRDGQFELLLGGLEDFTLHQLAQTHHIAGAVGDFDTHIICAGDGGFNTHIGGGQGQGQVVGQPGNFTDFDFRLFGLAFDSALDIAGADEKLGDSRPGVDPFKVSGYAKQRQCILDQPPPATDVLVAVHVAIPGIEHIGQTGQLPLLHTTHNPGAERGVRAGGGQWLAGCAGCRRGYCRRRRVLLGRGGRIFAGQAGRQADPMAGILLRLAAETVEQTLPGGNLAAGDGQGGLDVGHPFAPHLLPFAQHIRQRVPTVQKKVEEHPVGEQDDSQHGQRTHRGPGPPQTQGRFQQFGQIEADPTARFALLGLGHAHKLGGDEGDAGDVGQKDQRHASGLLPGEIGHFVHSPDDHPQPQRAGKQWHAPHAVAGERAHQIDPRASDAAPAVGEQTQQCENREQHENNPLHFGAQEKAKHLEDFVEFARLLFASGCHWVCRLIAASFQPLMNTDKHG